MGSIKKKLVKGLRKITPKEIAPALPFLAMAIPGMGFASSALLRYGLPQLLTAAASARQTGDINLLNQALALGASYAAGPGTAGATNKEAAFMNKNVAPGGTTPVGFGAGQVDPGLAQAAGVNTNPALIDSASKLTYTPGMNAQQFAGANPDAFKAFKTANPGVKNTFAQNLNASLRPIGEGIQAMGSGDILDPKALMVVGGGGGTMATADYAKKKEIEFEEEEARKQGYIGDYADAINAYKDYFRNATYDYEDIYGIGRIPSFLAADGGRVGFDGGGDVGLFESILGDNIVDQIQRGFVTLLGGGSLLGTSMNEYDDAYDQLKEMGQSHEEIIGTIGERPELMGKASGGRVGAQEGGIMSVAPGMPAGMQVDGRNGTFIPMGVKEKADDVPAMLSKNEFVMTADAVKGLGNGSPELGAQRMYDLMNTLEAKV